MAQFPLGIKKGQRFDMAVRQITNRRREVELEPPKTKFLTAEEARKLLAGMRDNPAMTHPTHREGNVTARKGQRVFDLGDNKTLYTDLSIFDMASDGAVIVEHPDPDKLAAARRSAGLWRETVGSFQLGVPVSVKDDMLLHHMRLLSVFRWRAEKLRRDSRWYKTFIYYLELVTKKVQALGGNPFAIPATPDGNIEGIKMPPSSSDVKPGGDEGGVNDPSDDFFESENDDWLGGTNGLGDPDKERSTVISGKVSGLLFDHFGDFEGFTVETYAGQHYRFFSRENAILNIVERAWKARYVVTVITVSDKSRSVRRVLIRGGSGLE